MISNQNGLAGCEVKNRFSLFEEPDGDEDGPPGLTDSEDEEESKQASALSLGEAFAGPPHAGTGARKVATGRPPISAPARRWAAGAGSESSE